MDKGIASFLCLAFISVAYINGASGIERLRLSVSQRKVATMLGVYTFAGVVALPLPLLACLVVLVYAVAYPKERRAGRKLHRHAYTTLSVTVACLTASAVLHRLPEGIGLPLALMLFTVINGSLIAFAIAAAGHADAWAMFRSRQFYSVLGTTLPLGAAVGTGMQHLHPLVGAACLPLTVGLHRWAKDATVQETRACVGGVWNPTGWLALAEEAHRLGDRMSVVLVELPDAHEMNVATEIVQARFGAEPVGVYAATQLVILLQEAEGPAARYLALRLTVALDKAGLHAGVGCADSQGGSVAGMLVAAAGEAIICRSLDGSDSELR